MLDVWGTWQDYTLSYLEDGVDSRWEGLDSSETVTSGSFVPRIYYGVTDRLTVRASFPLEDRYGEFGDLESGKSNSGLGDIIIDPKFQIFRSDSGYPRVATLVGVRLSTGATSGVDDDNISPLSDGSTDYMLGAVATHRVGSITAHACVTYWMNGQEEGGADSPDLWVGLASIETPLDESWKLLWEYKGVFSSESKAFYRTYACPGIAWDGERTTIGFSALVSAARKGGGYDYDWAPYLRIYYRFF
jgi:hypothetical protein